MLHCTVDRTPGRRDRRVGARPRARPAARRGNRAGPRRVRGRQAVRGR